GIDPSRFEFQLLYGMAGPIKRALVEMGYRVREYCPVGELLPGMAYLVRRLLENTSNEGFLRAKFAENVSAQELLRDPRELIRSCDASPQEVDATPSSRKFRLIDGNGTGGEASAIPSATRASQLQHIFKNAPLMNFAYKDNQEKMQTALREVRKRFGEKYPL